MKAKGKFITALMMLNAVFGGYALGFNSRHVVVIDPTLPPLEIEKKAPPAHHSKAASHGISTDKNSKTKHATSTSKDVSHEKKGKKKDPAKKDKNKAATDKVKVKDKDKDKDKAKSAKQGSESAKEI